MTSALHLLGPDDVMPRKSVWRNNKWLTGTDEDTITKITAEHTNQQRQEIKAVYKTMFGRVRLSRSAC